MLQKKQISIPIHDILHAELTPSDLDFTLIYKNQNFPFNSTYLASISQTIRDLFISDPLAFQYNINIQIKNKMKDIIKILSTTSFKVNNSNYADCFNLAIELRSDKLFSFIWNQINSQLKNKEILKYSVLAYNNGIEIPESLEVRLAEEFQNLFISGLVIELTPDESVALSLTDSDPVKDKEYIDRISTNPQQHSESPNYVGQDDSFGPTPLGLVYLMLKKSPSYMLSFIRNVIINRYVNQTGSNSKNIFLLQYDDEVKNDGKNLIDSLKSSDINNIRFIFNSMKEKNDISLNLPYICQQPYAIPSDKIFDYYNNYQGLIKTSIRPTIKAPKSLEPKYPLMNIFIYDDSKKISDQDNSYFSPKSYVSQEEKNNFIEFDFSPYYIKLTSFVMIDPPKSWELKALYPRKPDNYNYWFLIDKHISNSNSESQNIVFKDVKNLDLSIQKFKLQQPKDTTFRFSLNFIDFFGTIEKESSS